MIVRSCCGVRFLLIEYAQSTHYFSSIFLMVCLVRGDGCLVAKRIDRGNDIAKYGIMSVLFLVFFSRVKCNIQQLHNFYKGLSE